MDPDLGYLPINLSGPYYLEANRAFAPIEHGVLKRLSYDRNSARTLFLEAEGFPWPRSYRMSGEGTSIDDMIATTARGVLVTRLASIWVEDPETTMCTGYTRDGLWLIRNGKIDRPIKNFRFRDSIVSALNNVEQLGIPTRIFHPEFPVVVPSLKVREFNFVALSEAI